MTTRRARVFISYRRANGGADLATLVANGLRIRGCEVFLDVDDLGPGRFDESLLEEIRRATDVVVVLSKGSLDRQQREDDWVRREVARAILLRKNVIPLFAPGFTWPASGLPSDIDDLRRLQGLEYVHALSEASIDRLARLVRGGQRTSSWLVGGGMVAAAIALVCAALWLRETRSGGAIDVSRLFAAAGHDAGTQANVSVAALPDGPLRYLTERFELAPGSPSRDADRLVRSGEALVYDSEDTLELAFQLSNLSDQLVTLAAMEIAHFGPIVVYEDRARPTIIALQDNALMETAFVGERVDLGRISFTTEAGISSRSATSGSLLDQRRLEVIPARTVRSFLVRIQCLPTENPLMVVEPHSIVANHGDLGWRTIGRGGRGPSDSAATGIALSDLERGEPRPTDALHLFVVQTDLLTESGQRQRLYSDRLYVVAPYVVEPALEIERMGALRPMRIRSSNAVSFQDVARSLLPIAVKTQRETLAYRVAEASGSLPPDLVADDVSPYCLSGDPSSRLRPASERSAEPVRSDDRAGARQHRLLSVDGSEAIEGLLPSGPRLRSNIVDVFSVIREAHPPLWSEIEPGIRVLEEHGDAKAKYVRSELSRRSGDPGGR